MSTTQRSQGAVAEPAAERQTAVAGPAAVDSAAGSRTRWERWNDASLEWIAYIFLGVSTIFAMLRPDHEPYERLITLALVGVTAAWIYVFFTRVPEPRRAKPVLMLVYVVGLLTLGAILTTRNPMFFIFLITGFFHAGLLRP